MTAATPTLGEIYWGVYGARSPLAVLVEFGDVEPGYRSAIEAGAQAVADYVTAVAGVPDVDGTALPSERYALVEQMGFRRTYGTVRETEFAGKPMAEVTPLDGTGVRLVAPESLYQVTWLTRDQAERGARTGAYAPVAIGSGRPPLPNPWGDGEDDDDGERDTARRMDALDEAARLEDRL